MIVLVISVKLLKTRLIGINEQDMQSDMELYFFSVVQSMLAVCIVAFQNEWNI